VIDAVRGEAYLPVELGACKCLLDDGGVWWTYADFVREAASMATPLRSRRGRLAFLSVANDKASAAALLAAWSAGLAVALLDPALDARAYDRLLSSFRPEIAFRPDVGFTATEYSSDRPAGGAPMWRGANICLSTSGTTGTTKFVRLSESGVLANARQIAEVLHIEPDDVAVAHLPLHYSYGLSVLLSHLERGAAVFLTELKVTSPELNEKVTSAGGTHFPGVPFHYTVLARLGLDRMLPPCVRTFTQAGGHLDRRFRETVHQQAMARGARFYVMYGQTEASPRMTTLASEIFAEKPDSVGRAMPGARIEIVDDDGAALPSGAIGQVVYYGPNVMYGYATTRDCLSKDNEMHGRLETGDMGRLDDDGDLYIVGRNQRFAKIAGLRIGLDEVERRLKPDFDVALVPDVEKVIVFSAPSPAISETVGQRLARLADEYRIPARSFVIKEVAAIPILPSGKIDFARLRELE